MTRTGKTPRCARARRSRFSRSIGATLIQSGTLPAQKTVVGTVASIAELSERGRFGSPSVIVVGEVVNFAEKLGWFSRTLVTAHRFLSGADPSRGTESKAQSGA